MERIDGDATRPTLVFLHEGLGSVSMWREFPAWAAADDDEPATDRATGWWGSRPSLISLAGALVVLLTLVGLAALGLLGTDGLADLDEADAADQATRTAPAGRSSPASRATP